MLLTIEQYEGSRDALAHLFAEADDSESQIVSYKDLGDMLVARRDDALIGEALIIETAQPGIFELKSLAVDAHWRSQGVGAALVQAALAHCRVRGAKLVLVATAAASVRALKFYQCQGFRIRSVIRDYYIAERGYRSLELNGIPLLDEVILDAVP